MNTKKFDAETLHEFLRESNAIESEYDDIAFEDSLEAWDYAYGQLIDDPKFKFTPKFIAGIHAHLMRRLRPKIAGRFRNCGVMVGGNVCLDPRKISYVLSSWCMSINSKSFNNAKNNHITFEEIHPFEDGNGRTGRILYNIQRLRDGEDLHVIKESEKEDYYKWFR